MQASSSSEITHPKCFDNDDDLFGSAINHIISESDDVETEENCHEDSDNEQSKNNDATHLATTALRGNLGLHNVDLCLLDLSVGHTNSLGN